LLLQALCEWVRVLAFFSLSSKFPPKFHVGGGIFTAEAMGTLLALLDEPYLKSCAVIGFFSSILDG